MWRWMCNLALYIVSQIRVHRFFDTTGVDLVLHFVFFWGGDRDMLSGRPLTPLTT